MKRLTRESGHGARGDRFGRFLDLDEAHAAVSGDGESAVVAEPRDVDAGDLAGLKNGHSFRDFHGVAIHEHLDGVLGVREVDAGAGERSPRREIGRRRLLRLCGAGFGIPKLRLGDDGSEEKSGRVLGTEEEP